MRNTVLLSCLCFFVLFSQSVQAEEMMSIYDDGYSHKLCEAAVEGDIKTLRAWLEKGANVEGSYKMEDNITPIMCAAEAGEKESIRVLLEYNANMNAMNNDQHTALVLAACKNHMDTMELLLAHGAKVNGEILCFVADCGSAQALELLLKQEVEVNAQNSSGVSALDEALWSGKPDKVRVLLKYKADVNAAGSEGVSPLMRAFSNEQMEIAKLLLAAGADPHAQDDEGKSVLQYAQELENPAFVKLLENFEKAE